MRTTHRFALAFAAIGCGLVHALLLTASARAYDLSRQESPDKLERGFVTVQAGAWLPGPDTFNDNHVTSLQFGAELGIKVLSASDHHLFIVGGATYSPQNLEPHLDELPVHLIVGFGGVRYVPGALCAPNGIGCLFFELALGLTWEGGEGWDTHGAPRGELTVLAGIGYRLRLARFIELGARADISFLEETNSRQIGWFTPTLFAGVAF